MIILSNKGEMGETSLRFHTDFCFVCAEVASASLTCGVTDLQAACLR